MGRREEKGVERKGRGKGRGRKRRVGRVKGGGRGEWAYSIFTLASLI